MNAKVIQVTDTHLFQNRDQELKGVNTYETLSKVLDHVFSHQQEADALVLTGDLSQDETMESYILLKELLYSTSIPIYAIPGNHDNLEYMLQYLAGNNYHVNTDFVIGNWRWLMLNTQVIGKEHGRLGVEQLDELLVKISQGGYFNIVAMHHPPVAIGSSWIDNMACTDGSDFISEISKYGVKSVVCGHVHQTFDQMFDGVRVLTSPSTCIQFKPATTRYEIDLAQPGYRVLDLKDTGQLSTQVIRVEV